MPYTPPSSWSTSHKIRPQGGPEPSKFQRIGSQMYLFRFNPQSYANKLVISAHAGSIPDSDADAWFETKSNQVLHYYCAHGRTVEMASLFWATGRTDAATSAGRPRATFDERGRVHNYELAKCEGAHGSSLTYDFLQNMQKRTAETGKKFSAVSVDDKLSLLVTKLQKERPDVLQAVEKADAEERNIYRRGIHRSLGYNNNRELVPAPLRKEFEDALLNKKFYMPSDGAIPPADENFVDFDILTIRYRKTITGKRRKFTLKQAIEEMNKTHVYTDIHCSFCRE